jgi:hypothetical protein
MSSVGLYSSRAGTEGNFKLTGPVAKRVNNEDTGQHPVKRRQSNEDDSNDQPPEKKHCPDSNNGKGQIPVTETNSTSPWEKLDAHLSSQAFQATESDCEPQPYRHVFVSYYAPRTHHTNERPPWMAMLELWPGKPEKHLLQRMPWTERLRHPSSDTIQRALVPGRPHLLYARTIRCEDPTVPVGGWHAQISVWHSQLTWLANMDVENIMAFIKRSTSTG